MRWLLRLGLRVVERMAAESSSRRAQLPSSRGSGQGASSSGCLGTPLCPLSLEALQETVFREQPWLARRGAGSSLLNPRLLLLAAGRAAQAEANAAAASLRKAQTAAAQAARLVRERREELEEADDEAGDEERPEEAEERAAPAEDAESVSGIKLAKSRLAEAEAQAKAAQEVANRAAERAASARLAAAACYVPGLSEKDRDSEGGGRLRGTANRRWREARRPIEDARKSSKKVRLSGTLLERPLSRSV